jgi:hypothetical protein
MRETQHHSALFSWLFVWWGRLTVGFLVPGTGTATTELLGLRTTVVGDEQCAVVLNKSLLQLVLGVLIDVLLVVGDDGLGDGLADGVDLGGVTTTGDTDADVDTGELVSADDQERLVDLFALSVRFLFFLLSSFPSHLRDAFGWVL